MYKFELKIIEVTKNKEEIEIANINAWGFRTIKSTCQEIRRKLLPYVSKNKIKPQS